MSIPQPYDTGLTEEQLAEAFRRALGDMTDEAIENAIATAINLIPKGLVYRGAYNYFSELPTNAKEGEVYTVKYKGTSGTEPGGNEYAWGEYEGTLQWIPLGVDSYTKKEIDEQRSSIESDILNAQNIVIDYTASTPREKLFTFSRFTYGLSAMNTGALLVTLYDWSTLPTETNKSNLYLVSWSGGISYNYKCTVRIQPILATNPNLTLEIQSFTANDITFKAKTGMWTITPLHTGNQVSSTPVETTVSE